MRRNLTRILAAVMIAAFSVGPASAATAPNAVFTVAQSAQSSGTISGKVLNGTGGPLGGARIAIAGPKSAEVITKPDGTYSVSLPPGVYAVTISASGFQSTRQDSVLIFSGEKVLLDTTLLPASLSTIASVSTSSSTSVSTSAASSTILSAGTIQNQGQVQVVNVLDQVPGIEIDRVNGGSNEPGANTALSIRGAQPYESQVLIDGHPINTIGNGAFGFNATFINALLLRRGRSQQRTRQPSEHRRGCRRRYGELPDAGPLPRSSPPLS